MRVAKRAGEWIRHVRDEFTFKGLLLIPAAFLALAVISVVIMLLDPAGGERHPAQSPTPTSTATRWECAQDPETGGVADCWVVRL